MKKKLSLLFLALVATIGAWATDVTVSTSTGTFYNDGTTAITPSSSNQFASKWTSTATGPQLTMTCSGNNMIINSGDATDTKFRLHGNNLTYTLTVDDGYLITGYSITGYAANGSSTINGTTVGTTADAATTVSSTSLTSATATFTVSGTANPWMYITDFTVTVEEDPDYVDWTPSITGAYVSVGEKVESFSAVTDPADNTKWYILTQVRGGETPMYNVSTGSRLKRAATSVTAASLNETLATESAAYLIRFVAAADAGTYNIQFADGDWITSSLTTASSKSSAGTYAFYNSNGGSGSYFAWNLNSTSGSIVDNNAAGGTLAFWGSGTVSGTSGNNVWYMYETDVEVPASTVDVTYNFVVGGSTVNTATVTVPANSAVSIPSGLTDGYSTDYYTIATSGTIGSEDCTITVTGTLNDATIVYPITSVSNGKAYYITTKNDARGSLTTYTDGTTTYLASEVKSALGVAEKKFAIVSYEDNYYLWSVSDNGFVTYSESQKAPVTATISDASDRVTFTQTIAPLYEIRFDGSTSKIFNSSASYTYGMVFNTWGSSSSQWDDGCQYTIHEADDFDATAALAALEEYFHPSYTVTYVVKDASNNILFTSDPVATTNGANITTLPEEYQRTGFYTYNTVDVTISTSGNTNVEFTATPKAEPIVQYTADTTSPYYYNLNIRSKYLVYDSSATGEVTLQNESEPFNTNAAWAFIGEPYAGFKVINQAKGTDYDLTYTSVVTGGNGGGDGSNNNVQFVADADFNNRYWIIESNTGGFCMRMKENTNIYFHHQNITNSNGYLRTCSVNEWSAVHNDAGSTIVASTDEDVLIALYEALAANSYGTAIGLYNSTDASLTIADITSTLAGVDAVIQAGTTSAYGDAYAALVEISGKIALVTPTAGYYRVKNVATGKYLNAQSLQSYSSETTGVFADGGANSAATVIRLYDKDNDGHLYMYNQGYGFGWVVSSGYGSGNVWMAASPDKYVNWFPGTAAGQIAFAICLGNGASGYESYLKKGIYTTNAAEAVIGGTDETADAAQWIFEPATDATIALNGPVDSKYYATLCVPFDVTLSGATAYTLTKDGTTLNLSEGLTSVAAGTPVLLEGTNASATATIGTNYSSTISTETALTGSYLEVNPFDGDTNYVLGTDGTKVGFFHWDGTTLKANRAYIAGEAAGGAKGFYLDDSFATAIQKLTDAADGNAIYYDLSGRRVAEPKQGLYIVNGKKVVVK